MADLAHKAVGAISGEDLRRQSDVRPGILTASLHASEQRIKDRNQGAGLRSHRQLRNDGKKIQIKESIIGAMGQRQRGSETATETGRHADSGLLP